MSSSAKEQVNPTQQASRQESPQDLEKIPHEPAQDAASAAAPELGKGEKKQHWLKTESEHVIPNNNMWIVLPGLMLVVFLAALDQTIVSTALPVIVDKLDAGPSVYSWIGSAYLLLMAVANPLYSRGSDLVGRKPLLYFAIVVFLIGSAICGAAQNGAMICVFRGVQGVGGGGIIVLANVILSDLVPLEKRGAAQGTFGFVWGLASVVGPLLGGALTSSKAGWRWCFFLNLPVGGAALAILAWKLNLNPAPKKNFREVASQFDIIGYLLIAAAVIFLLLGFSFSETDSWNDPKTIAFITIGGVLFIVFGFFENWIEGGPRPPIVPTRLFKNRTTALILLSVACHAIPFFSATYYLPLYFQAVHGSSPLFSGVQMLPFSLLSAIVSMLSGLAIVKMQAYRPVLWFGFGVMTIGYALMATLDADSSAAQQEIYIGVAAFGLGNLFQTPLTALTAATPLNQMARVTGSMQLVRSISGAAGISLAGAIFNSAARSKLSKIDGYVVPASPSSVDAQHLIDLQPPQLANSVVHAYADGLQVIYIAFAPVVGVGFLAVLFVKGYSLKRNVRRLAKGEEIENKVDVKKVGDEETGTGAGTTSEADEIRTDESHGETVEDEAPRVESKKGDLEAQ